MEKAIFEILLAWSTEMIVGGKGPKDRIVEVHNFFQERYNYVGFFQKGSKFDKRRGAYMGIQVFIAVYSRGGGGWSGASCRQAKL